MVQPPKPGSASFDTYVAERDAILVSLKRRAVKMTAALNALEGVSCNAIDGAMYAFPTIQLSRKYSFIFCNYINFSVLYPYLVFFIIIQRKLLMQRTTGVLRQTPCTA